MPANELQAQALNASVREAPQTLKLSPSVRVLLDSVRGQIRKYIAIDGFLISTLCLLAIFWFGALIDYFPVTQGSNETPNWVRAGLLLAMGLAVSWALIWRLARRILVSLPDRNMALLVERRFPGLNNQLVTVVDLADRPSAGISNPNAYQSMLDRVHESVSRQVVTINVQSLINWRPIWLLSFLAFGAILATAAVAITSPDWMRLWASRIFALSNERWPRMARLRAEGVQYQMPTFSGQLSADRVTLPFVDSSVRVLRSSSVLLQVSADTHARQLPELCTVFYRLADGSRGRANMRRLGSTDSPWQPFMLDGPPLVDLSSDVEFDVVGGDARLDQLRLHVVDPVVTKAMSLDLTYPTYLSESSSSFPPREQIEFRSGSRIPEGTAVRLLGTASGPLREVQYMVRSTRTRASSQTVGMDEAPEATTTIQSTVPNGNRFDIDLGRLLDTAVVEIRLIDQYGLSGDQIPRYVLTVANDVPPHVETKLVGIGTAVTPNAYLPLSGSVTDDHSLARVWVAAAVNESPPLELDVQVDANGKLDTRVDLQALSEKKLLNVGTDSSLGIVVMATDRFDLDGKKHVGSSQPFQLAVVSPEKLLVMLDRQELELRQRLELIISELTQLREVVRELSRPPVQTSGSSTTLQSPQLRLARVESSVAFVSPFQQADDQDQTGDAAAAAAEQARRITLLRAQQSVLQADKSQQELIGVAARVEDVRLQLVHNRIDSIDRQARLQDRVHSPLKSVLANEMDDLRNRLNQMQSASMSPAGGTQQASQALEANDRVLVALDGILNNMLDLESFNEIVELVRGILEDEETILNETQKRQKESILNMIKELGK